jgi:hypothetical protein
MRIIAPVAVAVCCCLTGCSGVSVEQCRDDYFWYQVGWTAGSANWDNRRFYSDQCESLGIQLNEAHYEEGKRNGQWSEAHRYPL